MKQQEESCSFPYLPPPPSPFSNNKIRKKTLSCQQPTYRYKFKYSFWAPDNLFRGLTVVLNWRAELKFDFNKNIFWE